MKKQHNELTKENEEIIVALPAGAMETLAAPFGGQMGAGYDTVKGDMYMTASPAGRDKPFPCFMKSNWTDQVVVKVVQQRPASEMV